MKYTKTIFNVLIVALLSTAFIACNKGDDDDNTPTPPGGGGGTACDNCSFSANVAEASVSSYSATTAKAVWTKQSMGGGTQYTFYVAGEDKTNKRMLHFFLYESTEHKTGTYQIKFSNSNQGIYIENYNASGEKGWLAPGPTSDLEESFGTVTITDITATRAKGTFSFTAYENVTHATTRTVTSGSFDVPLTKQGF